MKYLQGGTVNGATPVFEFTIKLSDFHDTFLAMRKAIMLPEIVMLRVVWGPVQRFAWKSVDAGTSDTDPFIGAIIPTAVVNITELALYLALETNDDIINDLLTLQRTGYEMAFPSVSSNKQATTASTTQSITVKVTPDMGFLLKQIVYGIFHTTDDSLGTSQDHDNRNGSKLVSYQTQLDSRPQQNFVVRCGTNIYEDWKLNERFCKGTAIQSRDIYQYNWFHCEDFSDMTVTTLDEMGVPKENVISGRPIVEANGSSERIWTIAGTSVSAAYKHYTFIVTWRTLKVTPSAVMVLNTPPS